MMKEGMKLKPEFMEYIQEKYAIKTQVNYLRSLRHLEAQGIVLEDKELFRSWAISQRNRGMRDRTLNVYLKAYNAYLDFLRLPRFKPYKTFDAIKRDRATMDDYRLLLKGCRGYTEPRDSLIVELLFKAGIRYRELISLSIDSITEDKIIVEAGKNQKYREIVTFPSVYRAYRSYLPFRSQLIRRSNRNTTALLVNQYGDPVTVEGGRHVIYRIAKRAGIEFSPHRARRFFARHLWESGVRAELIQKAMGHEKLDTTLTYIAPDGTDAFEEMRARMKKLDFSVPLTGGGQILEHMGRPERVAMHMLRIWRESYAVAGGLSIR